MVSSGLIPQPLAIKARHTGGQGENITNIYECQYVDYLLSRVQGPGACLAVARSAKAGPGVRLACGGAEEDVPGDGTAVAVSEIPRDVVQRHVRAHREARPLHTHKASFVSKSQGRD